MPYSPRRNSVPQSKLTEEVASNHREYYFGGCQPPPNERKTPNRHCSRYSVTTKTGKSLTDKKKPPARYILKLLMQTKLEANGMTHKRQGSFRKNDVLICHTVARQSKALPHHVDSAAVFIGTSPTAGRSSPKKGLLPPAFLHAIQPNSATHLSVNSSTVVINI